MPERPSLEAQIDDDEAWLAANDDDDWDAPAAPPAPAAAPGAGARCRGSAGAGRGAATGEHTTEAQRTVDTTLAAAQVCVYDLEGELAAARWWAVGRLVSGRRARFGATAGGGPRPGRRRTGRRVRSRERCDASVARSARQAVVVRRTR